MECGAVKFLECVAEMWICWWGFGYGFGSWSVELLERGDLECGLECSFGVWNCELCNVGLWSV